MLRVGELLMPSTQPPTSYTPANFAPLDFATARSQIAALQAQERQAQGDATINPVCYTRLLDHGQRTRRVVVCYHGYTNCPFQFQALAENFYAQGNNVFLPRLPYHGLADRMTVAQAR